MQRIVVATDRSETAGRAVAWAADLAARTDAELVLLQVVADEAASDPFALRAEAERVAGPRGRARVHVDPDPSHGIVTAAEEERADVLVVGKRRHGRPQGVSARQRPKPRLAQCALHRRDRQHDGRRGLVVAARGARG
ncbi:MAG: universal stress protein, partial [Actinobacteria bacterium]|nr:universal stress protein [Actinomycetota bacterium]